jgi:hypothetical protein
MAKQIMEKALKQIPPKVPFTEAQELYLENLIRKIVNKMIDEGKVAVQEDYDPYELYGEKS